MADDAGSLLVRAGLIDDEQLLAAREAQAAEGGTVGEHLVLEEAVDDEELTAFYRNRLLVPRINPNDLTGIPERVIGLLPPDMAAEFRAVPVYLDRDQNLTLAMSDPSTTHAVDEIGFFTGTSVVRAVATQHQIAWCLAHYYGVLTPLGATLLEERPAQEPAPAEAEEAEEEIVIDAEEPDDAVPQEQTSSVSGRVRAMRHQVVPPVDDPDHLERPTEAGVEARAAQMFSGGGSSSGGASRQEESDTGPTGKMKAKKRPPQEPSPPELAPKAGEVEVKSRGRVKADSAPAVLVDDSALSPDDEGADTDRQDAVPEAVEETGTESRPILLQPKQGRSEEDQGEEAEEDVVLLERPKRPSTRRHRQTQLGLGALGGSEQKRGRTVRDTDLSPPPRHTEAPAARSGEQDKGYEEIPTQPRLGLGLGSVDEGWGPPGTTIPPAYLGAMPGTYEEAEPGGSIPIPVDDEQSTPHSIAAAARMQAPPDASSAAPAAPEEEAADAPDEGEADEATSVALEESSVRLVETLRRLDRATERDEVIEELIEHLRDICRRVAFFVARRGGLAGYAVRGAGVDEDRLAAAEISLDEPSTLRDAVRARLPYHGPVSDQATRAFLERAFGEVPAEILAVPVTVRDRVVGILYADGKRRPIFSAHLSAVSHAAGLALERILKSKKKS